MAKKITIYTTNTCANCVMVKKWLAAKGQTYEEVNVEQHPDRREEPFKLSGQFMVPVTVVEDGADKKHVIVGSNLAQLAPAIA